MKKLIATIAALAMAFALCSCGRSADSETKNKEMTNNSHLFARLKRNNIEHT